MRKVALFRDEIHKNSEHFPEIPGILVSSSSLEYPTYDGQRSDKATI